MTKRDMTGYNTAHVWRLRNRPKRDMCQSCHRKGQPTHWANISGTYRDPADDGDWIELCPACHKRFDFDCPKDGTRSWIQAA